MNTAAVLTVLVVLESPAVLAAQSPADAARPATVSGRDAVRSEDPSSASPRWYLGVGWMGSHTQEGDSSCPYMCGNLGGWSLGATFVVGHVIDSGPHLAWSAEVETATGTSMETPARQRTGYYAAGAGRTFTASRRTIDLALLLRVRRSRQRAGKTAVEAAGGLLLQLGRDSRIDGVDTVYQGYDKPLVKVPSPELSQFGLTVGIGGGIDVVSEVRSRLGWTTGVRFYMLSRDRYTGDEEFPIPGSLVTRLQVGLRWSR